VTTDYSTVTETWGLAASPEQVSMQYARYKTAGDLADEKRLLEIGLAAKPKLDAMGKTAKDPEIVYRIERLIATLMREPIPNQENQPAP